MELLLEGQGVVVFGSARGIGREIAKQFAMEGCRVIGFDLQKPASADTDAAVLDILGDVTDSRVVAEFAGAHNQIQHVVYSVGVGSGVPAFPFWNQRPEDWARVLDVNLIGAVNVAHAFAPRLAEQRAGTMLFLASVAAQIGSQTDPPYSAAKAALINFMQCAARDLAPFHVRANALSPGMVKTDLNRSVWAANQQLLPPEKQRSYEDWTDEKIKTIAPLGRWQSAAECAAAATFLASDHARNVTGQTWNVDGGQVMHS